MSVVKRVACIRIENQGHDDGKKAQKLAEACLRLSPQIALRGEEAVFLEVGKCLSLFSEKGIELRIFSIAKRLGLSVQVSFASSANWAWLRSHIPQWQGESDFASLVLESLIYFLPPFERDLDSERKILSWIPLFRTLGVVTVKDFLSLPVSSLGSRFGKEAVLIHFVAKGGLEPAWKGFQPSLKIEEKLELQDEDLEGVEVQLEPLLFALKTLVDRALCRLRGLGQRASQVQIVLRLAPWSVVKEPERIWKIDLPVPQGSYSGLMPILREHLSFSLGQSPLVAPARALQFQILESVPGQGAQRDFFHSKELEEENWDQLLGRLISQLGEGYVFHGVSVEKYRPEKSWIRKLILKRGGDGCAQSRPCIASRPTRLLEPPEPIQLKPSFIQSANGKRWPVRFWKGPERVSTEWWKEPEITRVDRDYYVVTTSQNERLWIFLDRTTSPQQAFLHGYFD